MAILLGSIRAEMMGRVLGVFAVDGFQRLLRWMRGSDGEMARLGCDWAKTG